ncbi:MAG: hypothetical protein IE931_14335 [Sphingobacteriales bacterium]|nr:hypothetical protein [Sphingobacteriales bacterium]
MKKSKRFSFLFILFLYFTPFFIKAQETVKSANDLLLPQQDLQWYRGAKFRIFIHWELYCKFTMKTFSTLPNLIREDRVTVVRFSLVLTSNQKEAISKSLKATSF